MAGSSGGEDPRTQCPGGRGQPGASPVAEGRAERRRCHLSPLSVPALLLEDRPQATRSERTAESMAQLPEWTREGGIRPPRAGGGAIGGL